MSKEVVQPNLPKPDLEDPFTWASISRVHTEWLRQIGPQLNLDVPKMILGDVLVSIIGDDANAFGYFFMPKWGKEMKALILERMDWEITTPETPEEVKQKLTTTRRILENHDFTNRRGYKLAKDEWMRMKSWVKDEIKRRPEWSSAEEYHLEANKIWSHYWSIFIYGKDPFDRAN